MLTEEEIVAIKVRCEAATAGPWDAPYSIKGRYWIVDTADDLETVARVPAEADAWFIAHARQDVPALLAHIAELEARLKPAMIERPPLVIEDPYE